MTIHPNGVCASSKINHVPFFGFIDNVLGTARHAIATLSMCLRSGTIFSHVNKYEIIIAQIIAFHRTFGNSHFFFFFVLLNLEIFVWRIVQKSHEMDLNLIHSSSAPFVLKHLRWNFGIRWNFTRLVQSMNSPIDPSFHVRVCVFVYARARSGVFKCEHFR